jgi:hypothetical protein
MLNPDDFGRMYPHQDGGSMTAGPLARAVDIDAVDIDADRPAGDAPAGTSGPAVAC